MRASRLGPCRSAKCRLDFAHVSKSVSPTNPARASLGAFCRARLRCFILRFGLRVVDRFVECRQRPVGALTCRKCRTRRGRCGSKRPSRAAQGSARPALVSLLLSQGRHPRLYQRSLCVPGCLAEISDRRSPHCRCLARLGRRPSRLRSRARVDISLGVRQRGQLGPCLRRTTAPLETLLARELPHRSRRQNRKDVSGRGPRCTRQPGSGRRKRPLTGCQLLGSPAVTQLWKSCLFVAETPPPGGIAPARMAELAEDAFAFTPA